jgi:hypothetical protein
MAEWRNGEWQNGGMAGWRNGGMVFYYIRNLSCYIYGTRRWQWRNNDDTNDNDDANDDDATNTDGF